MFTRVSIKRHQQDEAEKPFWISFSDLMSACMTLFLIVMAVMIMNVNKNQQEFTEAKQQEAERQQEINQFVEELREKLAKNPKVKVVQDENSVHMNLGAIMQFGVNAYDIPPANQRELRAFTPLVLSSIASANGQKWVKWLVVEGFTDQDGTYLDNVTLSLNRSRSVLCTLFTPLPGEQGLSLKELNQLRSLATIGGYSSNSAKPSKEESRRVELSLEFRRLGEDARTPIPDIMEFGRCR